MKTKTRKTVLMISITLFFLIFSGFYLTPWIPNDGWYLLFDSIALALSIPILLFFSYDKYFEGIKSLNELKIRYENEFDEKGVYLIEKRKPLFGPILFLAADILYIFFFLSSSYNFINFLNIYEPKAEFAGWLIIYLILFIFLLLTISAISITRFSPEHNIFNLTKKVFKLEE